MSNNIAMKLPIELYDLHCKNAKPKMFCAVKYFAKLKNQW